ncbi:MAG: hypothetical protein KBS41_05815 [Oscillospiraceae bacterium]|nr:hypothetical protein [Candidatus Equicaccousia limihippi]
MKIIKVITAVMLCLSLLLAAGCETKPDPNDVISVETKPIAENVKKGVIPEAKYALGTSPDEIDGYYKDNSSDFSFTNYMPSQVVGTRGEITVDNITYYYRADAKDKGITAIASVGDTFGYMVGTITTVDDIKNACGEEAVECVPTEADTFFLYGGMPENSKMVQFTAGDNTVKFIFCNDQFSGAVLCGPDFQ